MITYLKKRLPNGLTLITHCDPSTEMAAVNVLYKVGSRNEDPSRTGFAHLFEHLMFRGTKSIPDFDTPIQRACGDNNAFTNNDYTDYYMTLPKDNVETALWLESDRMMGLDITKEKLETEKKVVLEEFNQRYLNQPYGDLWMLLREMVYTTHPYRWTTIGMAPDHIRGARLEDVTSFYERFYSPSNAIVSIASGNDPELCMEQAERWFTDLPGRANGANSIDIPVEPKQTEERRSTVERDVPSNLIVIAFRIGGRLSESFYRYDIISDLLSGGTSSRMYNRLVKEKKMFSSVNAFITGDLDPGMFVVTGQILEEVTPEAAEAALWEELERMKQGEVSDYELEKVKNKFEAETSYGELNIMNKALNLGFYEMLGDLELINREVAMFRAVEKNHIAECSAEIFQPHRCSTLLYLKK